MNFSQFLNENLSRKHIKEIDISDAKEIAKKHCQDILKNIQTLIYRGMEENPNQCYLLDTTHTQRKGTIDNASDAYRIILDHTLPRNYPKRRKSFICTTGKQKAHDYGSVYVILPFNDSLIVNSNNEDIWDTFYDGKNTLEDFAKWFENQNIELDNTYEEVILSICKSYLDELPSTSLFDAFYDYIEEELDDNERSDIDELYDVVDEKIRELFDVNELDFDLYNPKNFKCKYKNCELWIANKLLAIPLDQWESFKKDI